MRRDPKSHVVLSLSQSLYGVVRSASNGFFVVADGLDMLAGGLESYAHGVNRDVRRPQFLPRLGLSHPLVEIAVARVQARFYAQRGGIAASLPGVAAQAFDGLAHLVVGRSLREPAVAKTRGAAQQHIGPSTHPYGDRTAHGEWI